jgi:uncharacterized protein YcfL
MTKSRIPSPLETEENYIRCFFVALFMLAAIYLYGCSSSEETKTTETKQEPQIVVEPLKTPVPKTYDFRQWCLVSDAQVAEGKTQDAMDVFASGAVSVKRGTKQVMLLDKIESGNIETILAIEFDEVNIGKPANIKPLKVTFYRFFWNDNKRIDGKACDGYVFFEAVDNGFVSGNLDVNIVGVSKSWDKPDTAAGVNIKGTFRLRLVGIDSLKANRQGK